MGLEEAVKEILKDAVDYIDNQANEALKNNDLERRRFYFGTAVALAKTVLEFDSNNKNAIYILTECHFKCQDYERAIYWIDRLIQITPDAESFMFNASYLIRMDENDKAEECLKLALKKTSDKKTKAIAYNMLGINCNEKKAHKKALIYYTKAIKLMPEDGILYSNKGLTLFILGKYEQAIKYHIEGIRRECENREVANKCKIAFMHADFARTLIKLEKFEEALREIDIAIETRTYEYPKDYVIMGDAYKALGYKEDAIKSYLHALNCLEHFLMPSDALIGDKGINEIEYRVGVKAEKRLEELDYKGEEDLHKYRKEALEEKRFTQKEIDKM